MRFAFAAELKAPLQSTGSSLTNSDIAAAISHETGRALTRAWEAVARSLRQRGWLQESCDFFVQ